MKQTMFFGMIFTIFSLAHVYIGLRMIPPLNLTKNGRRIAWTVLLALFILQISGIFAYRAWTNGPRSFGLNVLTWGSYLVMGPTVILLFLNVFRDFLRLSVGIKRRLLSRSEPETDPGRRLFLTRGASYGLLGLSAGLSGAGFSGARGEPTLERVDVFHPELPEGLSGLRIAQISDLHVGPTLKRDFVEDVVRRVNAENPDLLAMTGDMIDGYPHLLRHDLEPLADLSAPRGRFWVTGNHEYYWGAEDWMAEARRLGFEVLLNDHRVIRRNGARLVVAGVPDTHGGRFLKDHVGQPAKALEGAGEGFRLLLAHQPRDCFRAAEAGFHLQLSGHTHGGQFFPWNLLVRLQQPFVSGLNRMDNLLVYTNRGTGYWGPPVRLGVSSEVTILRLRRGEFR